VAGLGIDAARTSSSATEKLRVTPVTMASASPSATMQAAKWLRSWLTRRWHVALQIAVALQPLVEIGRIGALRCDSRALMISMPPPSSMPRRRALAHARPRGPPTRGAELLHEARGGAVSPAPLALGEDHALRCRRSRS
jgi:hypothetical protein